MLDSDSSSDSVIVVCNKIHANTSPLSLSSNSSFAVDQEDDASNIDQEDDASESNTSSISFDKWHDTLLAAQRRFAEEERLRVDQWGRGGRAAGVKKGRGARRR